MYISTSFPLFSWRIPLCLEDVNTLRIRRGTPMKQQSNHNNRRNNINLQLCQRTSTIMMMPPAPSSQLPAICTQLSPIPPPQSPTAMSRLQLFSGSSYLGPHN